VTPGVDASAADGIARARAAAETVTIVFTPRL